MNFFTEYTVNNYPTVLLVAAVIVILMVNRNAKIEETGYLYILSLMALVISLLEFSEVWIDTHNLDYRLLFYKAMLIYTLYPAVALIFLYTICDIKHKFLIAIPQIFNMIVNVIDLSGSALVYTYEDNYSYHGGPLNHLAFVVEDFYVIIIAVYSIRLLRGRNRSKGIIVVFMMLTIFLAQLLTLNYMPIGYLPAVIAVELFTYYFYLAAIQYVDVQEQLHESSLALEHNRCNLLMAQIRPHFINSNLAVIRSLCYEDADKAVEMIDHFSGYLQENIKQIEDMRLVSFDKEMESVENYLYLERMRFPGRIELVRNFTVTDFSVPPLSVQTIVENAVRYGISMKGEKGTITISTEENAGNIIIKIIDDGKGFDVDNVEFDGVEHVGIKNVRDRFERILGGEVTVNSEAGKGTVVTLEIPDTRSKHDGR